ncbi:MAG: tetratricopeptide repeat protein [Candidatus Omnitrophica bacterium]|nr:tetratricopeptide repeat protein [Candidatus Omnitrophota bacterium]MBU4477910.1 tetratricopeptide repeat protein [Candidatus Omnitrophota bacterium]
MSKKTIRFLALITVLMLSGCGQQYMLERMIWQADKMAENILASSDTAAPYVYNKTVALYETVIAKTQDPQLLLNAQFKLGKLHTAQKSFDKARDIYDKIFISHQGRQEVSALALFSKGQTFELEGKWPEALAIFDEIIKKYRNTAQGLNVPLYIARYYGGKDDPVAARAAYARAVSYYEGIAQEYPNTKIALLAYNLIVRTYVEQNDWQGAVRYIEGLDAKYSIGPETLFVLGGIYSKRLDNPGAALATYKKILERFPDFANKAQVEKEIEQLSNGGG